jgi:hypothetical protein
MMSSEEMTAERFPSVPDAINETYPSPQAGAERRITHVDNGYPAF